MEYFAFEEIEKYIRAKKLTCKASERDLQLVLLITTSTDSKEYRLDRRLRRRCNADALWKKLDSICDDLIKI
jgi:hypothetical protein